MVLTPSTMLPLGTELPSFVLPDTISGQDIASDDFRGSLHVIGFICNHCPFVVHIQDQLAQLCNSFKLQGLDVVMISANDPATHPQDAPDKMKAFAKFNNFQFPYCFDEEQVVARAFDAACTPEFYLFNQEKKLIYRGQFDSSRPGSNMPVTGEDLQNAVKLGLTGQIREIQKPSVGCNIKWRSAAGA